MTAPTLAFQALRIDQALGIRRGAGFALEELSPRVNLIFGPNGSGKTTTALVLQELLWPGATGLSRPLVAGRWAIDGHLWRADVAMNHVTWDRDGREVGEGPTVGPAEHRHRYRIALHELLDRTHGGRDFAAVIAREMQGGLNLAEAAERLGFRERPPYHTRDRDELRRLRSAVEEARHGHEQLQAKARDRDELARRREQAVAADANVRRLEVAREYRLAGNEIARIDAELAALPDGLDRLTGDERQQLERIAEQRGQLDQARREAEQRRDEARATIERLGLPDGGVATQTLAALDSWCEQWDDRQRRIEQRREQRAEAEAELDAARRRLGEAIDEAQLERIDRVEVEALTEFARKAEALSSERAALEAEQRRLEPAATASADDGQASSDAAADGATLQRGLYALGEWLKTPATASASPADRRWWWLALAAAGGFMLLAVALAAAVHVGWLALLGVALAVAVGGWWLRRNDQRPAADDDRRAHRRTFEGTGLAGPASWEVEPVVARLEQLQRRLAEHSAEQRRAERRRELDAERQRLDARAQAVDAERQALVERYGVAIRSVAEPWLATLAANLAIWQRRSTELAGHRQALAQLDAEAADLREQVNQALQPFGYDPADDPAAARQLIRDLESRGRQHDDAHRQIEDATRTLERHVAPQHERLDAAYRTLFEDRGLTVGDEAMLLERLDQRPRYVELHDQRREQQTLADQAARKLDDQPALLELDLQAIDERLEEQRELAERREALTQQIAEIDHSISQAKQGAELTDALARRDSFAQRFLEMREDDCRQVVGSLLVDHLRQATAKQSQPPVLQRADRHLRRITNHRLSLEVDTAVEEPTLLARDHVQEQARGLNELSAGERTQLLLAVRIGFLEHEEPLRLPLILDEALGVSDDARSAAMIDAVIEIARTGRQVFYFTAQHDEVGKWRARLKAAAVDHRAIDLAQARAGAVDPVEPLPIEAVPPPEPPSPEGRSYEQYGRDLGVPRIDPWKQQAGDLHLWHLLDDAPTLHRLLAMGIERLGPLRSLAESGEAATLIAGGERVVRRAEAAAAAIEAACRAWRVGRGRPVDRAMLADFESVSDRFFDEVAAVAEACDGDAARLLDRVGGEVKGWGPKATEKLRAELEDRGCLDDRAPLSRDEMRARVLAAVAAAVKEGLIDAAWIDRLLTRLDRAEGQGPRAEEGADTSDER